MTKRPETPRPPRLSLLAAVIGALALLAAGAQTAAAAPAATQQATSRCWLDVVNDWLAHNQVEGTYPIPCYTQAIQHLNEYPDIQSYSSAARRHPPRACSPRFTRTAASGPATAPRAAAARARRRRRRSGRRKQQRHGQRQRHAESSSGPITSIIRARATPSRCPLPLIVLGVLAGLLLLAGAATWIARRLQGRRSRPTPAPIPRRRLADSAAPPGRFRPARVLLCAVPVRADEKPSGSPEARIRKGPAWRA